jgi:hypothetical protein
VAATKKIALKTVRPRNSLPILRRLRTMSAPPRRDNALTQRRFHRAGSSFDAASAEISPGRGTADGIRCVRVRARPAPPITGRHRAPWGVLSTGPAPKTTFYNQLKMLSYFVREVVL